jgi:L-ascorbate metabolism protein UlaG (beta-lactamase superfamily)
MKLTWLGHACFRLDTADGSIVFDPYKDGSVPGCDPIHETADSVLCSHGHGDHNAVECVNLTGRIPSIHIERVDSYHDDVGGAKRGENVIHIVTAEGMRAAHFGDLGHMLSDEQIAACGKLDLAMIPMGGFYTIDAETAKELADKLKPRVVVPMHYRSGNAGLSVLAGVEEFTALCDNVTEYDGRSVEITKDTPAQTAVLKY